MEIYEQKARTWSYMSWNAWKNGSDVDVWWLDRLGKIECGWKLRFGKMDCWCRWRGVEDKEGDCLSTSTRMIRVVNDTSCYFTDSTVQSCQPSALISAHTQVKWGSGQGWVFAEDCLDTWSQLRLSEIIGWNGSDALAGDYIASTRSKQRPCAWIISIYRNELERTR